MSCLACIQLNCLDGGYLRRAFTVGICGTTRSRARCIPLRLYSFLLRNSDSIFNNPVLAFFLLQALLSERLSLLLVSVVQLHAGR